MNKLQRWLLRGVESDIRQIEDRARAAAEYHKSITRYYSESFGSVEPGRYEESPALAYRDNPWFYISVRRIADAIASLPLILMRGRTDPQEVPVHPLLDRLNNPNPLDTGYQFRQAIAAWLKIAGEAYVFVEDGTANDDFRSEPTMRPPTELRVLPVYDAVERITRPVPDKQKRIALFEHKIDGIWYKLPMRKVLYVRDFSAEGMGVFGTGAADVLQTTLALERYADAWNVTGFRLGGSHMRPVITSPEERTLTDVQRRQFLSQFKAKFMGLSKAINATRNKSHEPILLTDGFDVKPFGQTMQDLEFGDLKRYARETILGVVGIGPARGGVLENANYSNMVEQDRIFWESEVQPLLRLIEGAFNKFLVPRFGPDMYVKHDLSGVGALQENIGDWVSWASTLVSGGIITPAEARQMLTEIGVGDFSEEIEGSDTLKPQGGGGGGFFGLSSQPAVIKTPIDGWFAKADDRAMLKQQHEDELTEYEKRLAPDLVKTLEKWRDSTIKAIRAADRKAFTVSDIDDVIPDAETAQRIAAEIAERFHGFAITKRADEVLRELGLPETQIDLLSPYVQAFLQRKVQVFAGSWPQTVLRRLRRTIADNVASGASVADIAEAVREVFDGDLAGTIEGEIVRANTIARTEATASFNFGSIAAYEQSDAVERIEWLSARDAAVRRDHAEADGQKVAKGEKFKLGPNEIGLRYPGDPEGPPSQIINCRCTVRPVINEEKLAARIAAKGNGHAKVAR